MSNSTSAAQSLFPAPSALLSRFRWVSLSPAAVASVAAGYVVVARLLRYRRRASHDALALRAASTESLAQARASMTVATAQAIFLSLGQLEFPFMLEKALQFALFRTYGIPTISALLVQTSLFSKPATAHRRYADTAGLIVEFTLRDFGSAPFAEALARVNCIHATYREAGRISDADMLYTLALFALEPGRWVARHEWRPLSPTEHCAMGVLWRALGDAMAIPYTPLAACPDWESGAHWLADLAAWADAYEAERMVPAETSARTGAQTITILLWNVPPALKPLGRQAVAALMDVRLRAAMALDAPSAAVQALIDGAFAARRFALRWLALPRPRFAAVCGHEERDASGFVHVKYYQSLPYYVRPTAWNRWGPPAWTSWLMRLPVPGPDEFHPQGFQPSTAGPAVGKARQKAEEAKVLERTAGLGCPFAVRGS